MNRREMLKHYLNRILPVAGKYLRRKKIVFFNLQFTHLAVEAFGRCGVRNFIFFDTANVSQDSYFHQSYGEKYISMPCDKAMEMVLRNHNTFESGWKFKKYPLEINEEIIGIIKRHKPDLIIAGGSLLECRFFSELSRQTKVPTVVFSLLEKREVKTLITVLDSSRGINFSVFDHLEENAVFCQTSRVDFLESSDVAINVAKAMLLADTEFARKDFQELVYDKKRNNILRGTQGWPWWVLYGSEKSLSKMMTLIAKKKLVRNYAPKKSERLMIIGIGTASLLAGEAVNFFQNILVVDGKKYSIYNPVRQLAGTKFIGIPKPYVVQRIMSDKVPGKAVWSRNELAKIVQKGDHSISASILKIKEQDPVSIEKLKKLIAWFRPTVVMVGMGQTRDDNFAVTKILRENNIKHIVPAAFPLATHFKHIVVDGKRGPCYTCLQGRLPFDVGPAVELTDEQREMFYGEGGFEERTQPATIVETRPSVHSALRLLIELTHNTRNRSQWFKECMQEEQNCFVGGNSIKTDEGFLYGVEYSGQMVVFSSQDLVGFSKQETCPDCGRTYHIADNKIME